MQRYFLRALSTSGQGLYRNYARNNLVRILNGIVYDIPTSHFARVQKEVHHCRALVIVMGYILYGSNDGVLAVLKI